MVLTNTFFRKQPEHLITYRMDKTARTEPPFVKPRIDVVDYIMVHKRWQNNVKHVYSDIVSGIDSDHYPAIAEIRIKLKANYRKVKSKFLVQPCTEKE